MKICMVVPDIYVKGGIASVVNGYRTYDFGNQCEIVYIESYRNGNKYQKLLKAVRSYFIFRKELRKNRPDIVHIHSSFGPSFYRKLPFIYMAYQKKIPVINHIHGADFDSFYLKASPAKKSLIAKMYNKCQMLIALSDEWRERLALIVPREKIRILENYCQIPQAIDREKTKQILFMGEIGGRKGSFDVPVVLEKAFTKAGKTQVVMAGDGEIVKVKELLEQVKLSDTVSFPGWVRGNEKDSLLRTSGIFLFPSYNEGMPMAVLEAMAYGMAIVTTNVGGIPRLIEDGINGYLCEPGDTDKLADRLAELLLNETKRKTLGNAARQKAIQKYSIERHMAKLLDLYKQVLGERG